MNHDPTRAVAYLAGELTAGEHTAFEGHLLDCEQCWAAVQTDRHARWLVQQTREPAPAGLRQRVRDAITTEGVSTPQRDGGRRAGTRARVAALAAITVAVLVAAVAAGLVGRPLSQPDPISVAASDYLRGRLPGSGIPASPGPDLSPLRLTQTAAAAGDLAGLPVDGYAYRDTAGRRLLVYLGHAPFPTPPGAEQPGGPAGPWISRHHGVAVLCARDPHEALILGADQHLVRAAATLLDLT